MNTIWIVLPILTLLMFDLGLALRFEDFGKVFRHPWPIVVALVGQLVFLPAIALGLAYLLKLPPVFFIGLVLIACCPGGSSSNVFSKLANGDVALSVTLTALSSIITLFTIPVIMGWATRLVGESVGITLPVGNLIKQNLVLMLLPVLLGIGLHYAWPKTAEKVDKVLTKLAFPLLLVLITVFYIQHRHTIMDNIGVLGLCVTALILLAAAVPPGPERCPAAPYRGHRSRHAECRAGDLHRLQPVHLRERGNGHPGHPLFADDEHRPAHLCWPRQEKEGFVIKNP